jgi:hypothetical protein
MGDSMNFNDKGDGMSHRDWPRIYVCAPFDDRVYVRSVHAQLVESGLKPMSTWANASEDENWSDEEAVRLATFENTSQMATSDAMLVIARPGAGGEMFAEIARAQTWGKPIFWVGRRILSAFRPGVFRLGDCDDHASRDEEVAKAIAMMKKELAR